MNALLGIALRKMRLSHNYSQQYVANYLNISRNAYIDWENAKTHISIDRLNTLCTLYNVRLSKFIETNIEEKQKPVRV